jgi:choline dehydrogenase-like flavoprotein
MSDLEYDVVIVGAGITGAMVAKTLIDKGGDKVQRVLILEAGRDTGYSAEGYRSYIDNFYQQTAKVPNSPYPLNDDAPTASVLNLKQNPVKYPINSSLVQYGPMQFLSDYAKAQGGTTLHWLGTTPRMLPNDFNMNTVYGQGIDWPIDYKDLRPYYERAEKEIGVSADVEDQVYPNMGHDYFKKGYVFPMKKIPQSYLDKEFGDGLKGMTVNIGDEEFEVALQSSPQGRNSTPNPDYRDETGQPFVPVGMVGDPQTGRRCEGNSACTPICPVQAKYNANKTLNSLPRAKLEIRTQCVATRIVVDKESGRVSEIEYKHYEDPNKASFTPKKVKAKIFVLAAHAIENAKLLLASNVANSSNQVGRNLMDHLCMLTWGLMPDRIGVYRGPGSTSGIPSFRDGNFRKDHASFRVELGNWGWTWPTGAPNSDVYNMVNGYKDTRGVEHAALFGPALRASLTDQLTRQFRIAWELEQLPHPGNCVTIDPGYTDQLGNLKPIISYHISDYTRAAAAVSQRINDDIFQRLGIVNYTKYNTTDTGYFEYSGEGYTVNGAGHVVGTHRMGSDRRQSVVNRNQRTWDHENLYLVGCGNMTTLGTSNPTLTASALAIWAADNILKDL